MRRDSLGKNAATSCVIIRMWWSGKRIDQTQIWRETIPLSRLHNRCSALDEVGNNDEDQNNRRHNSHSTNFHTPKVRKKALESLYFQGVLRNQLRKFADADGLAETGGASYPKVIKTH